MLCPSRKGDAGTVNLNRVLQEAVNPPAKGKNEIKLQTRVFREGDKVMQIKNDYNVLWTRGTEEGSGIFNGDVGILTAVDKQKGVVEVDFDGRKAVYPALNLKDLELAYAVTVHKSQGSEFEAVILPVVDVPPMLCYRNLFYTALTRARSKMITIGKQATIEEMVRNDRKIRRDWEAELMQIADTRCDGCTVAENAPDRIVIRALLTLGAPSRRPLLRGTVEYRFEPARGVVISQDLHVLSKLERINMIPTALHPQNDPAVADDLTKIPVLPRIGVQFSMPRGSERLRWFGLGPMEAYVDKRQAARMGIWETSVSDHFEHYIRPQENMAHDDTKWAEIYAEEGHGLVILAADDTAHFSFNCSHFSPATLTATRYDFELVPAEETIVNVDMRQAGIGSNSCGPVLAEKYRIMPGDYRYSFRLLPARIDRVDPFRA